MKKLLKVIGTLFVIVAILVVLLSVAIKMYVTPERVKGLIEEKATAQLHRQVKLGGISVSLFSGLTVTDFALSEEPDFSKGTFVSANKFQILPQLLPLLSKKIYIDRLTLINPNVAVVRFADGKTYNFSSMTSPAASSAPATPSAPTSSKSEPTSPMAFLVSRIVVKSGHLSFVDHSPAAQSAEIEHLDVNVKNVSLVAPVDLQTSFDVKAKGVAANIDFEGAVQALKGAAKIKKLAFTSGESKIHLSGDVQGLTSDQPTFDVKTVIDKLEPALLAKLGALPSSVALKSPLAGDISAKGTTASLNTDFNLKVAELAVSGKGTVKDAAASTRRFKMTIQTNDCPVGTLLAFAPKGSLPPELKLGGATRVGVDVDGSTDNGNLNFRMDGKALDVAYGTSFKKTAGTPMSLTAAGTYALPLALNLRNIDFGLASLKVGGDGTYKSAGAASNYLFHLKTNTFLLQELSPMVPPMQEYGLAGKASTIVDVRSAAKGPDVKGTAQLMGASLLAKGVSITNISSNIDYTMTDTNGKLKADAIKHEFFSGQGLDLKWNLKDAADLAKIAGTADLHVGNGQFLNIQKLTADSKVARILFMPITLLQKAGKVAKAVKLPDFDRVAYKEIVGNYTFKAGTMNVARFDLVGDQVNANMKGTVGLTGTQPLNLDSDMKVAAGLVGGAVGEILNDEKGQTTLKMKVRGTATDPQVSFDLGDTGKKVLDTVKEKYGDQIKEQGQKLLKGLFNK